MNHARILPTLATKDRRFDAVDVVRGDGRMGEEYNDEQLGGVSLVR